MGIIGMLAGKFMAGQLLKIANHWFCNYCHLRRIEYVDAACQACGAIPCIPCMHEMFQTQTGKVRKHAICSKCHNRFLTDTGGELVLGALDPLSADRVPW